MDLQGRNTTSLQFLTFWVHFCILSPFTGWCWYSRPAWYHLRWISSPLKVQTLHNGTARYLYRTAVWYSSSSFFLIFQRQLKSIQETTQMIILAKIKLRFPSIVNHLLIMNFEMVWNEITTTEKMKQKLLFCSKLSVLHTIYQNIFWNTNFKTSRENFFVFKKRDPNHFHRKRQKCKNGLMLTVGNVFFLRF